eukprot:CAMPEP_0184368294 /NCGR_PEP_ID=MMETSP1089-20130417/161565_1 /TAXON_ID=38269 ORGANISM="Gloeochaete wittrockiana, Strain SAG46.84" /NCGR_SAMPLE_ID=MMETSP1089 /ASSEMBLY_ACC=CAM_ASM_000445 /LENGTH=43 /DNA_ID= /DNA_START= /DNA_END= /DNA_ORIENTATION=
MTSDVIDIHTSQQPGQYPPDPGQHIAIARQTPAPSIRQFRQCV